VSMVGGGGLKGGGGDLFDEYGAGGGLKEGGGISSMSMVQGGG